MIAADPRVAVREAGSDPAPLGAWSTHGAAATLASRKVFVTGAGGFIGASLVRALVRCGATVTALTGPANAGLAPPPQAVTAINADIADRAAWQELLRRSDVVIHLAGPPSVGRSFDAPEEYARIHVSGTLALLEACRSANVARLVYVSSAEVYGQPDALPVSEEEHPCPRSPYAASKVAAESFVGAYVRAHGLDAVVLRPFSVYGPGLPCSSVLGTILRQALGRGDIVLADLTPVRDYVFVTDVVDAILRSAAVPSKGLATYNVGSGVGTSVRDLARLTLRLAGRRRHIRGDGSRQRRGDAQIHHLVADTTRVRQGLDWRPTVSLVDGVHETLRSMEASEP